MENLTKEVCKNTVIIRNLTKPDSADIEIPEIIANPALELFTLGRGGLDELLEDGEPVDLYRFYTADRLFSTQVNLPRRTVNHAILFEESNRWKLWAIALKEAGLELRLLDLADIHCHACKTTVTISLRRPQNLHFGIRVAANSQRGSGHFEVSYRSGKIQNCEWHLDLNDDYPSSFFEQPWLPEIKIVNLGPLVPLSVQDILATPPLELRPLDAATSLQALHNLMSQPQVKVTTSLYDSDDNEKVPILQFLLFGEKPTDANLQKFLHWKLYYLRYDIRNQVLEFDFIDTESRNNQNHYSSLSIHRPGNFDFGIKVATCDIKGYHLPDRNYRLSVRHESRHQRQLSFSDLLHGQSLTLTLPC